MNASVRKELQQIARPAGAVLAAAVAATMAFGSQVIEIAEPGFGGNDAGRPLGAAFALAGALLGWHQFAVERARSTESYLVHRDGGHASAFRAKCSAAWIALAIALATLAAAFVARTWLFDTAAPVARWDALRCALWTALVFVPAHAAGVFASQLRGSSGARVLGFIAAGGGSLVIALLASRPVGSLGSASIALYGGAIALTSWVWLALGSRMFAAGEDPDLPHRSTLSLASSALVLACAVPLVENVASSYQRGLGGVLEARRPALVADAERRVFLAARDEGGWREVDPASGERVGPELAGFRGRLFDETSPYTLLYTPLATPLEWHSPAGDPSRLRVRKDAFSFSGSWQHLLLAGRGEWSAWLSSREREVVAYRRSEERLERERLARPDGRGFSAQTVIVYGAGADGSAGILVDLADATAWRLDTAGEHPALSPLALPDGDRILGVEQLQSVARARLGTWEPFGYSDRLALRGERGLYIALGASLVAWTSDATFVAPEDFAGRVEYRVIRVGGDRIAPVLAVLDARDGRELLRHDFRPRGPVEGTLAGAIRAIGLLRSPLATLAGLSLDGATVRGPLLEYALHAARPWWFVHFALVLALALATHRRLAGASQGLRAFWIAAVMLAGPLGWAISLVLGPRRALQVAPRAQPLPSRPLLVTT